MQMQILFISEAANGWHFRLKIDLDCLVFLTFHSFYYFNQLNELSHVL